MSILVVGSVAFDTLETPHGKRERCLGGAATHFSLAASFFTKVRVIGVVGDDFTAEHEAVFTKKGIDISGIEHAAGKSFHWTGRYQGSLNEAETLRACIVKVLATFRTEGIRGEVIIADNGSTDASAQIAVACGARVVNVKERGYGNALRGGIAAAAGLQANGFSYVKVG